MSASLVSDKIKYVYFIRPKEEFNCQNMPVFLSCAYNEEDAWSFVLKKDLIEEEEYYIDNVLVSLKECPLGLLWV